MKKLLLFLFTIILLSCDETSKKETNTVQEETNSIQISIEAYLKPKLDDSESYEFVEMKLLDSVTFGENIAFRKGEFMDNPILLKKIDSLVSIMDVGINDVASYSYLFKFRTNNKLGATVLNEYIVQTDENRDVINMTNEMNKLFLNPNDFPGYKEMIRKHYGIK